MKPAKLVGITCIIVAGITAFFFSSPRKLEGENRIEFAYITNCFTERQFYFTIDGVEHQGYGMIATGALDPEKQYLIKARIGDRWATIEKINKSTAYIYNLPLPWMPPFYEEVKVVEVRR